MIFFMNLATFVLLSLTLHTNGQGVKTFFKHWTFREKEIFLSHDQTALEVDRGGETRFLYALCDEAHWKSKKICDFIVETYTSEKLTYKTTCKLKLETGEESRMISRNVILTHLGVEKGLIMWQDRAKAKWAEHEIFLKIRIVDWSNCGFTDLKIPIDMQNELMDEIRFNNVIVYDDTFDVFFYSRSLCSSGRCRVTYDSKGNRVGRIETFLTKENSPLSLIFPVSTSSSKGYYAFTWMATQLATTMVANDGETKDVSSVRTEGYTIFGTSSKCETFGSCWLLMRGDRTVKCTLVDSHARSKLNVTLNFGYKVLYVRMLNLSDGGFLLLQLVCTDDECIGYRTFYVTRVYSDGHHDNRPLELDGIDVDVAILDRYRINLFEKSSEEFCMSFAGPVTLSEFDIIVTRPELTYVSKCFHKKYVNVK